MSLNPEEYARAKTIFHKALPLRGEGRRALIEKECQAHSAIRTEVESLLHIHDGFTSDSASDHSNVKIALESTRQTFLQEGLDWFAHHRQARLALILGLMVGMLAVAKFGRDQLGSTLKAQVAGHLESVLNSNFLAIDLWSQHRFKEAEQWAELLRGRPEVERLLAISRGPLSSQAAVANDPAQGEILKLLATGLQSGPFKHFAIFDDRLRIIASDVPTFVGKKIPPENDIILSFDRILKGERIVTPRRQLGSAVRDPGVMEVREYYSWFWVPIRDKAGSIVAAMTLGVEASRSFDAIVKVGRWGESGETYAFNNRGQMLSDSRFLEQLTAVGLLSEAQASSQSLYLKDPGGDLLQGIRREGRVEDWPYTKIVSRALDRLRNYTDQMQGVILDPYRDYRGVEVVGAWRWHPNLNFGLITEVNANEALLTVRVIDLLYLILVTLFGCVTILAVISSLTLIRIGPAARLGARMGQYKLVRKLAEGGIGEIYLARHEFLKRPTAIKILKPDSNDPESLKRFEHEVQTTSQLSHHNTVAIYDFGCTADHNFYYAMEYLPGISLARLIELEKHLPPHRTIHLLLQICASLREAHTLGHIHRDIKPLNIMVCVVGGEYDVVKVVDFGLVKSTKSLFPLESADAFPASLRGTPAYMAPELLVNPQQADVCTDIYSLGVVAYKMLSGQNLFESVYEAGLFYDILNTQPRNLGTLRADLPPELVSLVMQCIEKDPRRRPASASEIATQLSHIPVTSHWSQDDARQWWELRDHLLMLAD